MDLERNLCSYSFFISFDSFCLIVFLALIIGAFYFGQYISRLNGATIRLDCYFFYRDLLRI
jgi:hypothetical protein